MTLTQDSARAASAAMPGLGALVRAELAVQRRRGGLRRWWIAAAIISAAAMALVLASIHSLGEAEGEGALLNATDLVGVAAAMSTLVLGVGTAAYVSREIADGTVPTTKILHPRHGRLVAARLLASTVPLGIISVAGAAVATALAAIDPVVPPAPAGMVLLSAFVNTVVAMVTVAMIHAGALILRRGAFIVAVALLVYVIVPLLLALASILAGPPWSDIAAAVGKVLPGTLVVTATSIPLDGSSWWPLLGAFAGVLAWAVVACGGAAWVFRREGYGEG